MGWPLVRKVEEKEEKEVSDRGEKKKGERIPIEIDRIRIQKGAIDLEDRKVENHPNHQTEIY